MRRALYASLVLLTVGSALAALQVLPLRGPHARRPPPPPTVPLAIERPRGALDAPGVAQPAYVGVVLPAVAADVAAPRAGKLDAVHAALGDRVAAGQLLVSLSAEQARLDRVRAEADHAAARAALARAQVEQQHAGAEAVRTDQLASERLASKEAAALARFKLRQSRSLAAEAESQLEEKRARLEQLLAAERDTSVRASFAGRVAARYVDVGASVGQGTPLLRLISEDQLILRFAVGESGEHTLQLGQWFTAEPSEGAARAFRAQVVRIAPEIDSASRMRVVEAAPDEPGLAVARELIGSLVTVRRLAALATPRPSEGEATQRRAEPAPRDAQLAPRAAQPVLAAPQAVPLLAGAAPFAEAPP